MLFYQVANLVVSAVCKEGPCVAFDYESGEKSFF